MELGGSLTERGDLPVGRYCPIERVLGTIGNRSSMVLPREAMYGATRFEDSPPAPASPRPRRRGSCVTW